MLTQETLIKRYREVYPKDTFQTISNKTNIQITRVFRIFNGAEMKLKEYLLISELLQTSIDSNEFVEKAKICLQSLSIHKVEAILNQMNHSLKLASFKSKYSANSFNNSLQA